MCRRTSCRGNGVQATLLQVNQRLNTAALLAVDRHGKARRRNKYRKHLQDFHQCFPRLQEVAFLCLLGSRSLQLTFLHLLQLERCYALFQGQVDKITQSPTRLGFNRRFRQFLKRCASRRGNELVFGWSGSTSRRRRLR